MRGVEGEQTHSPPYIMRWATGIYRQDLQAGFGAIEARGGTDRSASDDDEIIRHWFEL